MNNNVTNEQLLEEIKLLKKEIEELKLHPTQIISQPSVCVHQCHHHCQPIVQPMSPWFYQPHAIGGGNVIGSGGGGSLNG